MCDCEECQDCGCGVPDDHHGGWNAEDDYDGPEWWETY